MECFEPVGRAEETAQTTNTAPLQIGSPPFFRSCADTPFVALLSTNVAICSGIAVVLWVQVFFAVCGAFVTIFFIEDDRKVKDHPYTGINSVHNKI